MSLNFAKRISDPVHGTIHLTEIEARVIERPAFQRLRNVKQLGLASMVYPGCDYSRFSHSIGACHVAGRIVEQLGQPDETIQRYRLAALLHDCGHYPFSHAMERAVENHLAKAMVGPGGATPESPMSHEQVGKQVVTKDPGISAALEGGGTDPVQVAAIFTREAADQPLVNLVSSDLDADRIDYLLRTAHHSGLPYGAVDIDYLLGHLALDVDGRVCVDQRAARAVDHFLLCRFFDYQQVSFHKTVVGTELVLESVIGDLLDRGLLDCSPAAVETKITGGKWAEFDDAAVINGIHAAVEGGGLGGEQLLRARAILDRKPPKLIYQREWFGPRRSAQAAVDCAKLAHKCVDQLARSNNLPESRFYVWDKSFPITKNPSALPLSAIVDVGDDAEQAVRLLDGPTRKSAPAAERLSSMMSVLADQQLYAVRIYALLGDAELAGRSALEQAARGELGAP
jgi:hypothetical protein